MSHMMVPLSGPAQLSSRSIPSLSRGGRLLVPVCRPPKARREPNTPSVHSGSRQSACDLKRFQTVYIDTVASESCIYKVKVGKRCFIRCSFVIRGPSTPECLIAVDWISVGAVNGEKIPNYRTRRACFSGLERKR